MENEELYAQEEVVEQEEQTFEEQADVESQDTTEDETVTLSKSEFNKLKRREMAYLANKEQPRRENSEKTLLKQAPSEVSFSPERLDRIELMQEGYSKDEVDAIMELGGIKVIESPLVQSAIKAMRAEKKSKDASQPLSSKSPVFKKYTQEDLNKLTAAEMEKLLRE